MTLERPSTAQGALRNPQEFGKEDDQVLMPFVFPLRNSPKPPRQHGEKASPYQVRWTIDLLVEDVYGNDRLADLDHHLRYYPRVQNRERTTFLFPRSSLSRNAR